MTADKLPEIRLRAIEPEDLDFLYAIENDREIWNVGTTSVPYSRYTLYEYVANAKNDIYADRQVRMMIENCNGEIVGMADLINFDPRHMRAEIGIVIQKKHRHHGFAAAALLIMQDYALQILGLHQLYAVIPEANTASLALFERCGFIVKTKLSDWLREGGGYQDACLLQFFA